MAASHWPLTLVWIYLNAVCAEASSWTIKVPSVVKGQVGSCAVIPCSYSFPDGDKKPTKFTGIWADATGHPIYHPDQSKIAGQYLGRTALLGDIAHKNCSLRIEPLESSDHGLFHFRIELADFNNYSYRDHAVTIAMADNEELLLSVMDDIVEGQTVVASCSASPSCPTSLPAFSWNHSGQQHFHSLQFEGQQWKATATLTFRPTSADHGKPLTCTTENSGGRRQQTSKLLSVKYEPQNVRVEFRSDIKEGESVQLKCSSDAHPPASSYKWFNETGARLHRGMVYSVSNVSRHMGALYCTAANTVGLGQSNPVQLNVQYGPEIKAASCSPEGEVVNCMCMVDSKPPSVIDFVLSGQLLPGTSTERHGSISIGTLRAPTARFRSSGSVECLANSTGGSIGVALPLPVSGAGAVLNIYVMVAMGAGALLLVVLLAVGLACKCRRRSRVSAAPHMSHLQTNKEDLSVCTAEKRDDLSYDLAQASQPYITDHVYSNTGAADWDDAIYANM